MEDYENTVLAPNSSIHRAVEIIESYPAKIALVAKSNGELVGTITDGDIRRGILRGANADHSVSDVMNSSPKTASIHEDKASLLARMRRDLIRHLPLTDAQGRLRGLVTLAELQVLEARKNWVVLMAGGEGRRLRPFTDEVPKPLLKIGQKPILEHIVSDLESQGFKRLFLSVNYLANKIEDHFGDGRNLGVQISYLKETQPLGTCGSLSLIDRRPDHPILVVNGDVMVNIDFGSIFDFHQEASAVATVCVREFSHTVPYGVVEVRDDRLVDIVEKPTFRHLVNAGVYIFEPEVFDHLKKDERMDAPDLISMLNDAGKKVAVFVIHEHWQDIGRPDDLRRARKIYDGKN